MDFEALLEQERATKQRHVSSTNSSTKGELNEDIAVSSDAAEEIGEEMEQNPGATTAAEGSFLDI
jgi:hypothetical protein